jgi:hypothetical protein
MKRGIGRRDKIDLNQSRGNIRREKNKENPPRQKSLIKSSPPIRESRNKAIQKR